MNKTIARCSYSWPRKYKDTWKTFIDLHLASGKIKPSNPAFASPSFIIPKSDLNALPRWVDDYCELNANVVVDSHCLPRIDDILADCAKGKIWGTIDITDSFYQKGSPQQHSPNSGHDTFWAF